MHLCPLVCAVVYYSVARILWKRGDQSWETYYIPYGAEQLADEPLHSDAPIERVSVG